MKVLIKKIFSSVFLFSFMTMLFGCVKYDATLTINSDKSMDYSVIVATAIDTEGTDSSTETIDEKQLSEFKQNGFAVENYSDENKYKGYKISKHFNNIDDYSTSEDVKFDLSNLTDPKVKDYKIFNVKKGLFKNKYTAKFTLNVSDSIGMNDVVDKNIDDVVSLNKQNNNVSPLNSTNKANVLTKKLTSIQDDSVLMSPNEDTLESSIDESFFDSGLDSAMTSNFEIKFFLNLPSKAIDTNATLKENDDKKLTWDLTTFMSNEEESVMQFSFEMYNMLLIYISIGVVVIIIILLVAIILKKKKSSNSDQTPVPNPVNTTIDNTSNTGINNIQGLNQNNTIQNENESNINVNNDQVLNQNDTVQLENNVQNVNENSINSNIEQNTDTNNNQNNI